MRPNLKLIRHLRKELRSIGDPNRASKQKAYMKSSMPFYGIAAPTLRTTAKRVFDAHPFHEPQSCFDTVVELWRTAMRREELHASIQLLGRNKDWMTPDVVPVLQEMITSGAWWDLVDALATNHVHWMLVSHPEKTTELMREWAVEDDLWLRRTSIICQLKRKDETDEDLLTFAIEKSMEDNDFFARKAIGWALRQYGKTKPDWVRKFVKEREDVLSRLSIREALKHL